MLNQVAARIDTRSPFRSLTSLRSRSGIGENGGRYRAMADETKAPSVSAVRRLAVSGALLAAAALAFGLLAVNVDRTVGRWSAERTIDTGLVPNSATNGSAARPSVSNGATASDAAQIGAEPLTGREREVLSFVREGYPNKLISAELSISERTVKNHLTATMTKLRASHRTHAVVTAVRLGWLDL